MPLLAKGTFMNWMSLSCIGAVHFRRKRYDQAWASFESSVGWVARGRGEPMAWVVWAMCALRAGDRIVVEGTGKLRPGAKITERAAPEQGAAGDAAAALRGARARRGAREHKEGQPTVGEPGCSNKRRQELEWQQRRQQ